MQSAGGGFLVVGDLLYFYSSGRTYNPDIHYTTGLSVLRRDGFASMDAGDEEGVLTTRPLTFDGKHLFVNVATAEGQLQAEVLDADGQVIAPFSRDNSVAISADETLQAVSWEGVDDLSALRGRPVRLRFYLEDGSLYAFWVSPSAGGHSNGYVAAGGPGFTGFRDVVPFLIGDVTFDGMVDDDDLSMVLANWGALTDRAHGDVDGNGYVSDSDLSLLLSHWGQAAYQVPEPAALSLAVAGIAALATGRRRR